MKRACTSWAARGSWARSGSRSGREPSSRAARTMASDRGRRARGSHGRGVPLAPRAAKLTRRAETGALGDAIDVEPRLAQELACERDAQAVAVVGQVHARVLAEQA